MMQRALFLLLVSYSYIEAMPLDRVILATDNNPNYIEFWPLVAKAWKEVVGIKPTLALIATQDVKVDESLGDVIRFEPIPGIPTSLQAQCIRLLLPAYFPEDVCIVSDIDMMPMQRDYFLTSIEEYGEDAFVIYRDKAYEGLNIEQFPMCYLAAKGKTFSRLFDLKDTSMIQDTIKEWHKRGFGWTTDEQVLFQAVKKKQSQIPISKLGHSVNRRIDRSDWWYDKELVQRNYYIDAHMVRPYSVYTHEIDALAELKNLKVSYNTHEIEEAFVTFATENYFPLLQVLLESIKAFSTRSIVAFGVNADIPFSQEEYPFLIKRRINVDLNKESIFFQKPRIILESNIHYGVYIEADDIVNYKVDELFQWARNVKEFPLCPLHPNPPDNQDEVMKIVGVVKKSMPYVHGHVLFSYRCQHFIKEWYEGCLSYGYLAPNFDETILNVLLWKYDYRKSLPLFDPFFEFCTTYLDGVCLDEVLPNLGEIKAYMFHGCKNPIQALSILNDLKLTHKVLK